MAFKTRILKDIEFSSPDEVVEGRLLSAQPIRFRDGGINVNYLMKRTDGVIVGFKGSSMLNKLLFPDDVGALVRITYRGTDGAPVAENMSPRKIFDVEVDEDSKAKPVPSATKKADGDPGITDDDIPF